MTDAPFDFCLQKSKLSDNLCCIRFHRVNRVDAKLFQCHTTFPSTGISNYWTLKQIQIQISRHCHHSGKFKNAVVGCVCNFVCRTRLRKEINLNWGYGKGICKTVNVTSWFVVDVRKRCGFNDGFFFFAKQRW